MKTCRGLIGSGEVAGRRAPRRAAGVCLAALAAVAAGCGAMDDDGSNRINGSVHVLAGKPPVAAASVNGGIRIDADASVTSAETVNGSIELGTHGTADALRTVNGSILLDEGARVARSVESVNGTLTLHKDAEVLGSLVNVNGKISLDSAHVAGGIKTVDGDIDVLGATRVEGGIKVQKPDSALIHVGTSAPRIVIGPGAVVQGELAFERPVRLYVSDKASIGTVTGATPIPFTGDSAPP